MNLNSFSSRVNIIFYYLSLYIFHGFGASLRKIEYLGVKVNMISTNQVIKNLISSTADTIIEIPIIKVTSIIFHLSNIEPKTTIINNIFESSL